MIPVFVILMGCLLLIIGLVLFQYVNLWMRAVSAGAPVSFLRIIIMAMRKVSPFRIINAHIKSVQAGHPVSVDALEVHEMAGGNIEEALNHYLRARLASHDVTWQDAAASQLMQAYQ